MTKLSELLNSTPLSARQAGDRAKELGVDLPYGTIAGYWSGKHPKSPSEKTLEGLAEVTKLPLRQLRRAAGYPTGEDTVWVPPAEANRLDRRQRAALEELIFSIVSGRPAAGQDREDWSAGWGSDKDPGVGRDEQREQRH